MAAGAAWLLFPSMLHTPVYIDPLEPMSRVRLHSDGLTAAVGQTVPVVGVQAGELRAQVGLLGGVYMGFQPGRELTFYLLTFDGIFGIPVDVRWRSLEARLAVTHLSAHYGDGIRLLERYPGPERQGAFSREWVALTVGAHLFEGVAGLQEVYAFTGGRAIYHVVDDGGGAAAWAGVQADWLPRHGPFAAVQVMAAGEQDWTPNVSVQVGGRLGASGRIRLAGVFYTGRGQAGKESVDPEQHVGAQVAFSPRR